MLSTTLMPKMPGFEEACQTAHEKPLLKHVRLHLVLRGGPGMGLAKRVYKGAFNRRIVSMGLAKTHLFGSIGDYVFWAARNGIPRERQSFEIMIHPLPSRTGQLLDGKDGDLLEEAFKAVPCYMDAVSFSGPRYGSI